MVFQCHWGEGEVLWENRVAKFKPKASFRTKLIAKVILEGLTKILIPLNLDIVKEWGIKL